MAFFMISPLNKVIAEPTLTLQKVQSTPTMHKVFPVPLDVGFMGCPIGMAR